MLERRLRPFLGLNLTWIALVEPRLLSSSGVALLVWFVASFWLSPANASPVTPLLQMGCHDDVTFIHSVVGSCESYMVCYSGVPFTGTCPQGYIFSDYSLRCQLPNEKDKIRCSRLRLNNMPPTCSWNPRARVASYASCAQYFDCSATPSTPGALPDYVTECPYPQLFSTATGKCEMYYKVKCTGRTEPKAPCEYIQYRQLCQGPSCRKCEDRHPSCVGRRDGNHLVSPSTTVYLVCHSERTITIGRCAGGQRFSNLTQKCESIRWPNYPFSSSKTSSSSETPSSKPPEPKNKNSLSPDEIRALIEALKNPVIRTKQRQKSKNLPVPKVSIVTDPDKSILAIKGAAVMVLSLNKTDHDDQDNGGSRYPDMTSFPHESAPLARIMGNLRDELINFGLGKSKDSKSTFDMGSFPNHALQNPYS